VSRRLLLDTGVLIAVERGKLTIDRVVDEDDDVAIAAITRGGAYGRRGTGR
jgi:tRNA(fMet)-specific endonuclease VapC